MEWTLNNIADKLIKYEHKTCCVIRDSLGWQLQRWDDDTNYETLKYADRVGVSAAILMDIKKFMSCHRLLDCELHERQAA